MADNFYRAEITLDVNENGATRLIDKFQKGFERRVAMMNRAKISPTASIVDRITSPMRRIEAGLNRLSGVRTVTIKAIDQASGVLSRITSTFTSPLALMGGGAGLAASIVFPLKVSGEMDRARRSIEFYSGSLEEGKRNFDDFINFAIKSPIYELPFVTKTAGQLLATGQTAGFAKRALEAFGNAAMYTGAGLSQLELAFYGFKQISAVGTLSMEELRQVTENLNVPMAWVAEEMGLTGDQLMNIGKAAIPANRAMEAIVKTFEKRFPMKDFNDDLFALTSNVKESARVIAWQFGDGMAKPVISILQDLTGTLDPTSKKFIDFKDRVRDAGKQVGNSFKRIYDSSKLWFGKLASDPTFQQLDFGGKLIYIMNDGLDALNTWLDGPGGTQVQKMFMKLGGLAAQAWWTGLKGMAVGSVQAAAGGNIMGALGLGAGAMLLGGGMFVRGGMAAGKGLFNIGKKAGSYMDARAAARVAALEGTNPLAASIARGTYGTKAATQVAQGTKAATTGVEVAATATQGAGRAASALGSVAKVAGKVALPIALATELYDISKADNKALAAVKSAGGLGGGLLGAKVGAAIGTAILPGIGTAIGGVLGGVGGYIAGKNIVGNFAQPAVPTQAPEQAIDASATAAVLASFTANLQSQATDIISKMSACGQQVWNVTAVATAFSANLQTQANDVIARMSAWSEQAWNITAISTSFAANLQSMADRVVANGSILADNLANAASRAASFALPATPVPAVAHAAGGIYNQPHFGLLAEAGPEAYIPLSSRMRDRGLALWQQVGDYFGVNRLTPEPSGYGGLWDQVGSFDYSPISSTQPTAGGMANVSVPITIAGITTHINGSGYDITGIAEQVGEQVKDRVVKEFMKEIANSLENRI